CLSLGGLFAEVARRYRPLTEVSAEENNMIRANILTRGSEFAIQQLCRRHPEFSVDEARQITRSIF
ncbi:MAG: hypothetical protein M3Y49_08095, partial [Actinomycetota bacterium]|nr:hypothetical protein [Actinomycetota bacterium]